MVKYRSVHIPDGLGEEIIKEIKNDISLGYRNHSEFIIDATRRRLDEIQEEKKK